MSTSMETMAGGLEPRIRQDGVDLTSLVAYHIVQAGASFRLPRTPRSVSLHYFDETIGTLSEVVEETVGLQSVHSALVDISPEAL